MWRGLIPPGRFLARVDGDDDLGKDDDYTTGRWRDVGDPRAKTKTCQCLRGKSLLLISVLSVVYEIFPVCSIRSLVSPEVTIHHVCFYTLLWQLCAEKERPPRQSRKAIAAAAATTTDRKSANSG